MDTPDENTAATTRPLFGNKMALAAVENTQAEAEAAAVAQDEAMTAEAEDQPEATTDVQAQAEAPATDEDNGPFEDAAVSTEATDAIIPSAEPVEDDRLVDPVNEEAAHEAADDPEVPVEVDNTTVENLPVDEQNAVTEVLDTVVDTVADEPSTEEVQVAGEVEASAEDHAEAAEETAAALAAPVEDAAEVEQDAETDTTAVETVKVEPEAPATEDAKSVEELQAERQKLDDEIKAKVDAQKASVIAQIKTVADTYGITADELVEAMGGLKSKRKGVPAKPKYRDPATGVIWSGRGKEPAWIKGQDRTKFAI